jgi:hypothetical protein
VCKNGNQISNAAHCRGTQDGPETVFKWLKKWIEISVSQIQGIDLWFFNVSSIQTIPMNLTLFNDTVPTAVVIEYQIVLNKWLCSENLNGLGENGDDLFQCTTFCIFLEGLRKITEEPERLYPCQDSNQVPPKCKSKSLTHEPASSV